jgi:hypothetical protein
VLRGRRDEIHYKAAARVSFSGLMMRRSDALTLGDGAMETADAGR